MNAELAELAEINGILRVLRILRLMSSRGQSICDELARVRAAADGENDVLLAVEHVCHRRAALRRSHVDGADFFAAGLVVGAQHRAALAVRRGEEPAFA